MYIKTTIRTAFQGPMLGDFIQHEDAKADALTWSSCGETGDLVVNTRLGFRTSSSTGYNQLTGDSVNERFEHSYHLRWRKCGGDIVG
jgi:hypothetical protein